MKLFSKKIKRMKKGFTLIEILAVIIILGILVIIALPAVTKYIENSRRSALIDTAKQIISSARNYVNSGNLNLYNMDITYYMPISCFKSENNVRSINGKFTLAYVGVVYTGSGYNYYWTSVDEEGEGIRNLTSYDELDVDKIESGIKLSDIDTSLSIGGRTKTLVYNNDCTDSTDYQAHLVVTLDANEGEYSNGSSVQLLKYPLPLEEKESVSKYSHTQNINDAGEKLSNYGNNWTNSNIRGTDRTTSNSQAHVITIPGASSLHVRIVYGGESSSWDWVCMWKGNYPNYTASNNCGSSITGKLGGGNYTSASNTKEYDVDGDTVTFSFKSDGSGVGDGYGYYAVVTDNGGSGYIGSYENPTRDDYLFDGWEKDGVKYEYLNNIIPKDSDTYYAQWKAASKLIINPNGGYTYVDNNYISTSTEYYKKAGETINYSSFYHDSKTYSNGSWTITYNSNGGSTTPASRTSTVYYTCNYTFSSLSKSGDCSNIQTTSNVSATYEFPDDPGAKCTITPYWSSSCGSNFAYSYTLPAAPTRSGYRFLGWKSSATGAIYAAGASFTPISSETLTAQWEKSEYTMTLNANGGSYSDNSTSYTLKYVTSVASTSTYKKYSYTQNLSQNGYKSSDYGNNWTNSNIRGTDRSSSSSQAHVVSIPGADNITVEVYYNGESTSYDWVTVWSGSHSSYTAASNHSYGVTNGQKLGGVCRGLSYYVGTSNYYHSNVCKRTFGINGNSVSFGFKSDGSGVGEGFGYYAVVTGNVRTLSGSISGTYKEPTRNGYRFTGWKSSANNQIYTDINSITPTSDITLTAQWEEDNSPLASEVIGNISSLRNAAGAKRYYGSNPNNYVTFNGELWRIIGLYGNNLKIIKATPLSNQPWNSSNNTWSGSSLQTYLNGTYYSSLSSTARNMIYDGGTWNIGELPVSHNASNAYSNTTSSQWSGRVGLVATYEYLYARTDECLSGNGNIIDGCSINWITSTLIDSPTIHRAWTITPYNETPGSALLVYTNGTIDSHYVGDNSGATPVVYLKSTVKLSGGSGTSTEPYTIY